MIARVVLTSGTSLFARGNLGEGVDRSDPEALARQWRAGADPPNPNRVSAEFSAIHALRDRLAPGAELVSIHTATPDGALAARLVGVLLERRGFRVRRVEVPDLDVTDRERLRGALGTFMHRVATELRKGETGSTKFVPLGGYKVMTSLGYLTGAYCGYDAIYLHEDGQALHTIPAVPIRIDRDVLVGLIPLIRQVRRTIAAWDTLGDRDRATIERHPWMFERVEIDGAVQVDLTAFGAFLALEEPLAGALRVRVRVAAADDRVASAHADAVRRDVGHLLGWLPFETTTRVGELHHEVSFGHKGTRYALYKHGGTALRLAWRFDEADGVLLLRRIWPGHDPYVREAQDRAAFDGEPAAWVDRPDLEVE
ncbi:MAG: hypothetical protein ABMB14_28450 [Myxococcota bacterium]